MGLPLRLSVTSRLRLDPSSGLVSRIDISEAMLNGRPLLPTTITDLLPRVAGAGVDELESLFRGLLPWLRDGAGQRR
jgi:hypothetical protein